ncbi:hypothetical protein SAMN05421819_3536 [Bryocella elongata]|uniref:Uncharacterized protein n=1 Tax=Bryocella elongata TaxID=863522 RepID=A0A1H6B772_9BACT|nr:hypothetical protein [Bryocella elongata]SEG55976.1 hypothetical protein SAMN05421819_3536 [Bryocella elongata]
MKTAMAVAIAPTAREVQAGEGLGQSERGACGIKILCAISGCNAGAGRTGFCGECLPQVAAILLRDMRLLRINPATLDAAWFREQTGGILNRDESQELRRAVMAAWAGRSMPQGARVRDLMQDFDSTLVKDEPANRERRAALMAKLPRIHVEDEAKRQQGTPWWAWQFLGWTVAALIVALFLAGKGRAW